MEGRWILLLTVLVVFATPGAAVLVFANNTQVNITQAGCGVTKLCVEIPNNCNPAGNQSCLFMSVFASTTSSGTANLSIELSGQSLGYIALGLVNASEASTMIFICGQNSSANGTFFFSTMQINTTSDMLTPENTTVTGIQGLVNGSLIQCQFTLPNMNTIFSILLGNGTVGTNGFGSFTPSLRTAPLDFTDPASNINTTAVPTMVSNTTTMMTTAKGASGALHPQALLLLLSILTLSVLQKA